MNQNLSESKKRPFVSPLMGCCTYRDPVKKSCKWCPYFVPMSMCGTCMILGRVVSQLEDENEVCCEMGPKGLLCCCFSNALMGPPGYACLGFCLRQQVVEKFGVQEQGPCILNTLCYPCSYFQMYVSMTEWKADKATTASTGTAVTTQK